MNKKVIITLIIVLVIIIIIISLVLLRKNKENILPNVMANIYEVFEIKDINSLKYKVEKNKELNIASKYIGDNKYQLEANIEFYEKTGKMIYVREDYNNINIFQIEYLIDKYDNIEIQVDGIIKDFENMCKRYMKLEKDEEPLLSMLYGEDNREASIPLGESIYSENKLYSETYKINEKKYDLNFYRNNEKIICEFVYYVEDND